MPSSEKVIVVLTKKQKGFADSLIRQYDKGKEPDPKQAVEESYPDIKNPSVVSQTYQINLNNPKIKEYLIERIGAGEILDQREAFAYIQAESQELLTDTKTSRDNKTRLGVLQFIGKLYGLGADKVIIKTETITPRVSSIYDEIQGQG